MLIAHRVFQLGVLLFCLPIKNLWANQAWFDEPVFAKQHLVMATGSNSSSQRNISNNSPDQQAIDSKQATQIASQSNQEKLSAIHSAAVSEERSQALAQGPSAALVLNQVQMLMLQMTSLSARYWQRDAQYLAEYFSWPAWQKYQRLVLDQHQGYLRQEVVDKGHDSMGVLMAPPLWLGQNTESKEPKEDSRYPTGRLQSQVMVIDYANPPRSRLFQVVLTFGYRTDTHKVLITEVSLVPLGEWSQ